MAPGWTRELYGKGTPFRQLKGGLRVKDVVVGAGTKDCSRFRALPPRRILFVLAVRVMAARGFRFFREAACPFSFATSACVLNLVGLGACALFAVGKNTPSSTT